MSKTKTPKYVMKMSGFIGFTQTASAWKGRIPSVERLEREVMAYVVSTYQGFANEHLGATHGVQIPSRAIICENVPNGRVLVEWKAPMFMELPKSWDYPEVAKLPGRG